MSANVFLDTNIIIYGYSQDEPEKRQRARECAQAHESWISTQVLNETVNTLKRKFSLDYRQIGAVVDELSQQSQIVIVSVDTIHKALEVAQRYQYRAPRTIAWKSLIMRLGEMTTNQIRRWGSYGQVQRSGLIGPL
jgi:predicted nucleic acid-binding protein